MYYVIVAVVCILAGGAGGYLLGNRAIAAYEQAANSVGMTFQKVSGKVIAIKKAL